MFHKCHISKWQMSPDFQVLRWPILRFSLLACCGSLSQILVADLQRTTRQGGSYLGIFWGETFSWILWMLDDVSGGGNPRKPHANFAHDYYYSVTFDWACLFRFSNPAKCFIIKVNQAWSQQAKQDKMYVYVFMSFSLFISLPIYNTLNLWESTRPIQTTGDDLMVTCQRPKSMRRASS